MTSLIVMPEQDRRRSAGLRRLELRELLPRQADLVDGDVADLGRVVAQQLRLDQVAVGIDVDVGIDQIGLVGTGCGIRRPFTGWVGCQGCRRHDLFEYPFRLSLHAVNL